MSNLDVRPGHSFLNIGSGSGYLSTMVGLIIGARGINHGVEIYEDVVKFAQDRVQSNIIGNDALDEFEFCAPNFFCGNGLLLPEGLQYDRVYCGAAINEETVLDYVKGLIKVRILSLIPLWFCR